MQWNCRGVLSKWPEIKPILLEKCCDVICLQETHFLPTDIYDFNLHGYTIYNEYSNTGYPQGGVCIYVSNKWPHFQLQLNTCLQAVACSTRIASTRLTICSLYLPPAERLRFSELNQLITQLPSPFLICTDANSRHFLWGSDRCDPRGNIWEKVIRRHALNVLNTGCPTRMDDFSGNWSHIDVTLCSSDIGSLFDWRTDDDLCGSDHCPIYASFCQNQSVPYPTDTRIRWHLDKANWTEFNDKCDVKFDEHLGIDNCELMTETIIRAAKQSVPQKRGCGKYNCPWWNDDCRDAIQFRNRALNRFRRSQQYVHLMEYKQAKAKARQVIRAAKKESWQKLLNQFNHTTPINRMWDTIRCFTRKERFRRPLPVLKVGGNIVDDPLDVSNTMGQFFSDLSSSTNYRPAFRDRVRDMLQHCPDFSSDNDEIYNTLFTIEELRRAINLSGSTSVGPDSLHYMFFKQMNDTQLSEILKLFNFIWRSGTFPDIWRHSILIPIQKPGKPSEKVESYRPIQLTSCMCKLMERMIAKRLAWFVETHNILSNNQCAFRQGRSTVDHLIRLDSEVRRGFFYNKYTLAVFLDLKNAYNLTSTTALLTKMHSLGFRGRLMSFIQGYLRDRTFQVNVGVLSDRFEQENGLVQGGVISPILFNIIINDIFSNIPDNISSALFADDCSMWIQGRHVLPLVGRMQAALNHISRWTDQWGFVFSPQKCNAIIFRRYMRRRELNNIPDLTLYDQTISYSEEVKFLGVIFDTRLTLKNHSKYTKTKALKRMSILKCLSGRNCGADRITLLRLYKAMIRPILEYACQIVDGPGTKIIESLESVQNASLRIATGALRTSPIMPLLIDTDTYPLRLRRMDLTLRYCMKVNCRENHPCHDLLTNRFALHAVDKSYMQRISGFPLHERMTFMCNELQFRIPADVVSKQLSIAPWRVKHCMVRKLVQMKGGSTNDIHIQSVFHDLRNRFPSSAFIFTDGSKSPTGVGCAFVHGVIRCRFRLPDQCSVFTAEAFAVLRALQYIDTNVIQRPVVCSDSLSVMMAIKHGTSDHPVVIDIMELVHRLVQTGYDIFMLWLPGHCNIHGNELADTEAKRAMASPEICEIQFGYKEYRPLLRQVLRTRFNTLWTNYWPGTTMKAIREVSGRWESSIRTNRREEVILCRLRLGHTRLTHSYLIDHSRESECEHCQCPLSVQHILVECPEFHGARIQLFNACQKYGHPLSLKSLLGNEHADIIDQVFIFLRACDLLKKL